MRLACAPKVAPNDAERESFSLTMSDETLSRPTPPYASGTSTPSSPRSPQRRSSCRASVPVLLLEPVERRQHLVVDELFGRSRDQAMLVGHALRREDGVGVGGFEEPRAAAHEVGGNLLVEVGVIVIYSARWGPTPSSL